MKKKQKEILNKIISDNTSGSSEILSKLNKFLLSNIKEKELIIESLFIASTKLSHFAAIKNYVDELKMSFSSDGYERLTEYLKNCHKEEISIINSIFSKFIRNCHQQKLYLQFLKVEHY